MMALNVRGSHWWVTAALMMVASGCSKPQSTASSDSVAALTAQGPLSTKAIHDFPVN